MKWVEFVKSYASKNNKPYGQCLKDPECKKQYHEQKNNTNNEKHEHPSANVDSEESFILNQPIVSEISTIAKKRRSKEINNDNPFDQAGTLF
jgi:hypothetical protein